jgi:hypothetical protein
MYNLCLQAFTSFPRNWAPQVCRINPSHSSGLLEKCTLHELIEIKVALGNIVQGKVFEKGGDFLGYGLKFYETFSSLLQEKLELVDREIEKKMELTT